MSYATQADTVAAAAAAAAVVVEAHSDGTRVQARVRQAREEDPEAGML